MEVIKKEDIYKHFFDGGNGIAHIHVADIDTFPSIEIEPRKSGHWILTFRGVRKNPMSDEMECWHGCDCSVCGYHTGNQGKRFRYCPECGAKMDENFEYKS